MANRGSLFNSIKKMVEDKTRDYMIPYRKGGPRGQLKFETVNGNNAMNAIDKFMRGHGDLYRNEGATMFVPKEFQGPGRPVTEQQMRDNRAFNYLKANGMSDPVFYMKDDTGTIRIGNYGDKNSDGTKDYSYEFGPFHGDLEFVTPQERKYMQKWFEKQRELGRTAKEIYNDETPFTASPDGNIPSWKDLVTKK